MSFTTYLLTGNNLVAGTNGSRYRLSFNYGVNLTNKQIAISSINMFFSWFNITSQLNNLTIGSYIWPSNGSAVSSISVTANVMSLTVTSSANFVANDQIYIANMTVTTALNNTVQGPVTIVDPVTISFPYVIADFGPTVETGNTIRQLTYPLVLSAGGYSISDINFAIIAAMESNLTYLIDSGGNHQYYLSLVTNPSAYAVSANSLPLPTSLGTLTYPVGATWTLPSIASNPQWNFTSSGNFSKITAITGGLYPPNSGGGMALGTIYTINSNSGTAPAVSPIPSLLVNSNITYNAQVSNSNSLGVISPGGTAFGGEIIYQPTQFLFTNVYGQTYTEIDIFFSDPLQQNAIVLQDTNLAIQFIIRDAPLPDKVMYDEIRGLSQEIKKNTGQESVGQTEESSLLTQVLNELRKQTLAVITQNQKLDTGGTGMRKYAK